MDDSMIFLVGLAVFGLTLASGFLALIASDYPENPRR